MSINVQLHEAAVPYLVSPYESFFFLVHHVKLSVESGKCVALCVYACMRLMLDLMRRCLLPPLPLGSGYPGQGGCFFGREGRCYVSQYRLVFVSDGPAYTAYRSFSLPFYAIRDWDFRVGYFGTSLATALLV
jgi:hypothetical protein